MDNGKDTTRTPEEVVFSWKTFNGKGMSDSIKAYADDPNKVDQDKLEAFWEKHSK